MFHPSSFSPVSFSTTAFNLVSGSVEPIIQEGKSGYWRLFYSQLQEAELAKKRANPTTENNEESNEQVQGQATPQRARKAAPRKPAVVEREEFPEVRFKRKPIYTNAQPVSEDFPLWTYAISRQVDAWYASFIPLIEMNKRVIIETQQEAANDADVRLLLLLLAA